MRLDILFLTITIKKRKIGQEEANHLEVVQKLYEENKDRQFAAFSFSPQFKKK